MEKSRSIAGIVGPTLAVMVAAELKAWNPTLYDGQIAPLVYLSGMLFFVGGLSIVRVHHIWIAGWPVLITLLGWAGIILGLIRAFFPQAYLSGFENDLPALLVELVLLVLGVFLTFKAYWPARSQ